MPYDMYGEKCSARYYSQPNPMEMGNNPSGRMYQEMMGNTGAKHYSKPSPQAGGYQKPKPLGKLTKVHYD